ncbi:MAG: alpha/beta hydrolase [Candidatus Heimdallarchaeota archaeon]|nr:MAG: alpha/beta hydrolase [Candidatus Heimdallarchaeota archaeon]
MEYETERLNDMTRKTLSGDFIQLSDGFTHYEFDGPRDGDLIVLVHGFSTPLFIWDPTYEHLVNEGFKVLRYDLYGRGYSDRPGTTYNMDLFIRQLFELVKKLKLVDEKINLVGLSMGGGICVVFADKYPELVKKVSLIDPIGFPMGRNILLSILKIPIINNLMLKLYLGHKRIIETQKEDFYQYGKVEEYVKKYAEQLKYEGFLRAIRSTVLNTPFTNLKETYERLGNQNIPMQLFWGEKDQTIPYTTSQKVCEAVPSIEFHTIKESGHIPNYTHSDEVNPLLVKFLKD